MPTKPSSALRRRRITDHPEGRIPEQSWLPGIIARLAFSLALVNGWGPIHAAPPLEFPSRAGVGWAELASSPSDDTNIVLDDFDGVQTSWLLERNSQSLVRIAAHQRSDQRVANGWRSELLAFYGKRGGDRVYARHPIPPAAAIDEFEAGVWVCGTHPGVQFLARVRFPGWIQSGQPGSALIAGETYNSPGEWQFLRVADVKRKLAEKTRALRHSSGCAVDPRGAYIDQVVLNCYGGAGLNQVWTDDLSLRSAVAVNTAGQASTQVIRLANFHSERPRQPERVALVDGRITLDGRPWLPQVFRHQGESFESLKQLGINTVWLQHTATEQQLRLAEQLKLQLICPPPLQIRSAENWQSVVAWCIGDKLTATQFAATRQAAEDTVLRDPARRALLVGARQPAAWHRFAQFVVDQSDDQQLSHANLTSLGSPLVASTRWLPLRRKIHQLAKQGKRGFVFQADGRLSDDQHPHQRCLVELANLELSLLRSTLSQQHGQCRSLDDGPHRIAVFENRHAALALVHRQRRASLAAPDHFELPQFNRRDIFVLEPSGVSPLGPLRRVAGGVQVTAPTGLSNLKLLMTDQPKIVEQYNRFLRRHGPRICQLQVQAARDELLLLDRRIKHSSLAASTQSQLRGELHQLHSQIAPQVNPTGLKAINCRHLETAWARLERLHRRFDRAVADL